MHCIEYCTTYCTTWYTILILLVSIFTRVKGGVSTQLQWLSTPSSPSSKCRHAEPCSSGRRQWRGTPTAMSRVHSTRSADTTQPRPASIVPSSATSAATLRPRWSLQPRPSSETRTLLLPVFCGPLRCTSTAVSRTARASSPARYC